MPKRVVELVENDRSPKERVRKSEKECKIERERENGLHGSGLRLYSLWYHCRYVSKIYEKPEDKIARKHILFYNELR